MADDYQFKFTDGRSFVVKPYTFNGYATPDSNPLPSLYANGGITAVSANTSLVFVGKGIPEYGEAIQNNFLYLLEHFANDTAPIAPVKGQLWYNTTDGVLYVYDGSASWNKLIIETAAGLTSDLNVGGFRITNVGDPVDGTDAANLNAAESVATTIVSTHASDSTLHLTPSQNTLLDGVDPSITSANINALAGVTTPIQNQIDGKLSLAGGAMTGTLTLSGDPVAGLEAATKQYVDLVASSGGVADGVVTAGSLDPISGVLTLTRSIGAPVVVSGTFAPTSHSHSDSDLWHDVSAPLSMSWLAGVAQELSMYPQMTVYNAIALMDQTLYDMQRHSHRQIITAAGGETLITLNNDLAFLVNENKLHVYLNGVKQIASERGSSKVTLTGTNIGITTDTGLLPSTSYSFDITVDGGAPSTITVTTQAGTCTFSDLINMISAELISASLDVSVTIDQYFGYAKISFVSHSSGAGSAVSVSFGAGELFPSIVGTALNPIVPSAPVNTTITTDHSFEEVGEPNSYSTDIVFNTPLSAGDVLEIISQT